MSTPFPDPSNPYAASANAGPPPGGPKFGQNSHRGGLVLGLGIGALACSVAAFVPFCCCAPLSLLLAGVGAVMGGIAGFLGLVDIKAIDAGTMDMEGRGMTMAGLIMGWIGCVLSVILIILLVVIFVARITAVVTS